MYTTHMSNENTSLHIRNLKDYLSVVIYSPMKKRGKRKPFIGKEDRARFHTTLAVTRYPLGHEKEGEIESIDKSGLFDLPFYTNPFSFETEEGFAFTEPLEVECVLADLVNEDADFSNDEHGRKHFLQVAERNAKLQRIDAESDFIDSIYEAAQEYFDKKLTRWASLDEWIVEREGFSLRTGGAKLGNCYHREEWIVFCMGGPIEEVAPKGNGNNWVNNGKVGEHPLLGEIYNTSCCVDSSG